jgi:epoxyqueuosine reductase
LPEARSIIVVGMNYYADAEEGPGIPADADPARAVFARYARGDDYHDVMVHRLGELHRFINAELGQDVRGKAYVDTGPILERDLARRAGLGWIGKNTMLVNPKRGSFFFLGALLLDLDLEPDAPFEADRCGTCTRCLDACPTDAFVAPRLMDATRCISYLTIERRGDIDPELSPLIGELLYGCDICQDVCPWNVRFAPELTQDSPFAPRAVLAGRSATDLAEEVLRMTPEDFSRLFRGSPVKRAKLSGLKRNARVVLENSDAVNRSADGASGGE